MRIPESVITGCLLGSFGALGAATTIALEKVVTKYGHQFKAYNIDSQLGINGTALIGVIGAIQSLASFLFYIILDDEQGINWKNALMTHAAVAASLVGLSALAKRANLISSNLTVFAGALLFANSLITNMLYFKTLVTVFD